MNYDIGDNNISECAGKTIR